MILTTFGRFGRFPNFDKLYEKKSDLADFFFYKNYISHRDAIDDLTTTRDDARETRERSERVERASSRVVVKSIWHAVGKR